MHAYLKTIGFSQFDTTKKIKQLREDVINSPSRKETFSLEEENLYYYEKDYGECFGLSVIKVGDREEESEFESIFPFVKGYHYLYNENFNIDHLTDREGFYGYCDDNNIGIPMIFFINNPIDFRKMRKHFDDDTALNCVTLSGLAQDGIILLPIEKDEEQIRQERKEIERRNTMIDAAKAGNVEAMEQLTLQDMSKFTCVNIRSKREDLFSIVSSYFMPHTVECDKYSILGDIQEVVSLKNKMTKEELYYLSLNCNGIEFEVMVNKKDLMGIPEKGRRYKGHIWMQGQMDSI